MAAFGTHNTHTHIQICRVSMPATKMPLKARCTHVVKKLTKNRRGTADLFGPDRFVLMGDSNANTSDRNQYDGANDASTPAPTVAPFSPNQQTASRTRNQK